MQKRTIGNSVIGIEPLVLGGNVFGWTIDEAASFRVLDAFVDEGFDCIDTADLYSKWVPGHHGGESETIIGKWLKHSGKRSRLIIATKAGMELAPDKKGLSKAYILRAAEESLRRLQTDTIDLYQAHQDDPHTPLQETMEAFSELLKAGKVRAIGASNYKSPRLEEAIQTSKRAGLASYECLQPLYNLFDRDEYERELEPVCRKYGLGVIPYFSLASGFLTGKYRSEADLGKSTRGKGMGKYLNERGFRILRALDEVAGEHGSTPAKVSLAWLLAQPSVTAPIASATNLEQLRGLTEATRLKLDAASIEKLDRASAQSAAV